MKQRLHGLYAITDDHLTETEPLLRAVMQAIAGGASTIQYRDKVNALQQRSDNARALLELCREQQVPLIINDDLYLAESIGADGVHLGRHDGSIRQARQLLGQQAIIGASCYNDMKLAVAAQSEGADYVAFGSFFVSHSKPQATNAGLDLLQQAKSDIKIPIIAIGGITPQNGAVLIAAGADALAVIHGLFAQPDITVAAQQYAALFADQKRHCA